MCNPSVSGLVFRYAGIFRNLSFFFSLSKQFDYSVRHEQIFRSLKMKLWENILEKLCFTVSAYTGKPGFFLFYPFCLTNFFVCDVCMCNFIS